MRRRFVKHGFRNIDCDGGGKPELDACVEWSVYCFYRYAALTSPDRAKYRLGECKIAK